MGSPSSSGSDCLPESVLWLVTVAVLWGFTTPLLKRKGSGVEKVNANNAARQTAAELWYLASNWKYVLVFLINQSGSLIYALALGAADLSLAVPLTNALTFVFTVLAGWLLGETEKSPGMYLGMALVLGGIILCVADQHFRHEPVSIAN